MRPLGTVDASQVTWAELAEQRSYCEGFHGVPYDSRRPGPDDRAPGPIGASDGVRARTAEAS